MMVTRMNPFENASYETLIQNNLRGVVDIDRLYTGPLQISKDRK